MEMQKVMGSCFVLYSTEGETPEGAMSSEGAMSAIPGEQLPTPTSPPPVPQKRLDPLMASLTRMDPGAADVPTKNLPLLGEVPVDGSLALLVPAAVIAVLGFLLSIVVAFQSQDLIVQSLVQASEDIAQTASMKTNMVYDDNVCRGLCSSQEQDLDNLRNFMESLRKWDPSIKSSETNLNESRQPKLALSTNIKYRLLLEKRWNNNKTN